MTTQEYNEPLAFFKLESNLDRSFEPLRSSCVPRIGDEIRFWTRHDENHRLEHEDFIVVRIQWDHIISRTLDRYYIDMNCIVWLREKEPEGPSLQELYDFKYWEFELEQERIKLLWACCADYVWRLERGEEAREKDRTAFRDMKGVDVFAETLIDGRPELEVRHLMEYLEEYRAVEARCPVGEERSHETR